MRLLWSSTLKSCINSLEKGNLSHWKVEGGGDMPLSLESEGEGGKPLSLESWGGGKVIHLSHGKNEGK